MTHVTCRLTAKNRDQLRNPTLGNRVLATFTFLDISTITRCGVHCRAIFLWLCSKDLSRLTFDSVADDSPEKILVDLTQGRTTYAVVFEILCRFLAHSGPESTSSICGRVVARIVVQQIRNKSSHHHRHHRYAHRVPFSASRCTLC